MSPLTKSPFLLAFLILIFLITLLTPVVFSEKTWVILPMGNSNTMGVGNPSGCTDNCDGYRKYLKAMLTAQGYSTDFVGSMRDGSFSDNQHEGWSGHGITKMQQRVAGKILEATNPDFVLLMIGANDMWISVNNNRNPITTQQAKAWVNEIGKLMDEITRRKPNAYLIVANPITPDYPPGISAPLNTFRAGVAALVKQKQAHGKKILLIDCAGSKNDGVHFTPGGQYSLATKWFAQINYVIKNNLIKTPTPVPDPITIPQIPTCTESNWTKTIYPSLCPISGIQTTTWTKTGECVGGINHPNTDTNICTPATRTTQYCTGTTPTNSQTNYGTTNGKFTQKWDGNKWIPQTKQKEFSLTQGECKWKCINGFTQIASKCEENVKEEKCNGTLPENAKWNDGDLMGKFGQLLDQSTSKYLPEQKNIQYDENEGECNWVCEENYHFYNETCAPDTKMSECTLKDTNNSLPENAEWFLEINSNTFIQTWNGFYWSPKIKNAFYSEDANECAYKCKEQKKNCVLDNEKYCGKGIFDCNFGNWGECNATENTMSCTKNQFCFDNECKFCTEDTKNCDLNLLNGCETNIFTDEKNCGECETICGYNEHCEEGICTSRQKKTIETECNFGETLDLYFDKCFCETGYNDCDENSSNGCEYFGECELIKIAPLPDIAQPGVCNSNNECANYESCAENECTKIICEKNYSPNAHSCECNGTTCNNTCYIEEGVCCKNNWNKGIENCEYNLDDTIVSVNKAKDTQATQLLENAVESITKGEMLKAKAQASAAEIKALSSMNNNPKKMIEAYENALQAIEEKDYIGAITIVENAKKEQPKEGLPLLLITTLIIGIILIIIVLRRPITKRKSRRMGYDY